MYTKRRSLDVVPYKVRSRQKRGEFLEHLVNLPRVFDIFKSNVGKFFVVTPFDYRIDLELSGKTEKKYYREGNNVEKERKGKKE